MAQQAAEKRIVLITGASGGVGSALCEVLKKDYHLIGLDLTPCESADESYKCDFTSKDSISLALYKIHEKHGGHIACVIHLAAYYDFSGEDNPLYEALNVKGTADFLTELQRFDVDHFIYSSTMLIHRAGVPGEKIIEDTPIEPGWTYPQSKADAEEAIRSHHG